VCNNGPETCTPILISSSGIMMPLCQISCVSSVREADFSVEMGRCDSFTTHFPLRFNFLWLEPLICICRTVKSSRVQSHVTTYCRELRKRIYRLFFWKYSYTDLISFGFILFIETELGLVTSSIYICLQPTHRNEMHQNIISSM
jgi:hypothetical protein